MNDESGALKTEREHHPPRHYCMLRLVLDKQTVIIVIISRSDSHEQHEHTYYYLHLKAFVCLLVSLFVLLV